MPVGEKAPIDDFVMLGLVTALPEALPVPHFGARHKLLVIVLLGQFLGTASRGNGSWAEYCLGWGAPLLVVWEPKGLSPMADLTVLFANVNRPRDGRGPSPYGRRR